MLLAVLSWAAVVAGTALLPKRDIHGYDVTSTISDAIAPRADTSRLVFAHYMVGLTYDQAPSQWDKDISEAKSAGIDGFALNIGTDTYTDEQLGLAYNAAAAAGGFQLFLSFDMAASSWSVDQVVSLINTYKDNANQHKVDGLPFVSTFEGPNWEGWDTVRASTGGIFLVPDWSSLGPAGVTARLDTIDGAFNWGAWPGPNQLDLTTDADVAYQSGLNGKLYMMGVSPYFYTNLPQYSKNWYSSSDSLWFTRWKQVLEVLPDYVQIITWNDFGESSYIIEPVAAQIVAGAEVYVDGFDHSAFRSVLPYFIAAYKAGTSDVALASEVATAWYRTTASNICGDGGTVWGQGGSASAAGGTSDVISVIALSDSAADITVSIGGSSHTVSPLDSVGKAYFYQVPFSGETGQVTINVGGRTITGPAILGACPASGHVSRNSVASVAYENIPTNVTGTGQFQRRECRNIMYRR
ncbi:hypothetical protein NLU13_9097 [Sarocladium strictum]|uniref:Glycoside hydrolase family 71 protein n=1 Tax=Sarocladium strictum TaxID=5046 RepID=A0AA39GAX0_SARSR|nr:hypothetical protein NLU13_9097 [Sarocladium strictum]